MAALPPAGDITRKARLAPGYRARPIDPERHRRLGIEGTTLLRVFVQKDGRVAEVTVQESAGHAELDQAAANAVRRWRFEPALRGDEAVATWVELPVVFRFR